VIGEDAEDDGRMASDCIRFGWDGARSALRFTCFEGLIGGDGASILRAEFFSSKTSTIYYHFIFVLQCYSLHTVRTMGVGHGPPSSQSSLLPIKSLSRQVSRKVFVFVNGRALGPASAAAS